MERDIVTSEQIQKAREVNLLDYIRQAEPGNLIRAAPDEYKLQDHDSLKISNGKFHWFSRGIGGTNAIDYLVKVRGMEFKEAVRELAGDGGFKAQSSDKLTPPEKLKQKSDGRFFMLPEAHSNNNEAIAYLKSRGITETVINDCIQAGLLYQSKKQACVFVGFDGETARFACERGINSDFKKDALGSNKAVGFCMPPSKNSDGQHRADQVYVFEGVIDCLSHASIAQIGNADWDGYRLSLGGVSFVALKTFLQNNSQISTVYLCLDADKAGKEATERIATELLGNEIYKHINIFIAPPPIGKDYNDTVVFMQEKLKEREKSIAHETSKPQGKKRSEAVL